MSTTINSTASGFQDTTLLDAANEIARRVERYRERARAFFFEVMLAGLVCPECEGTIRVVGRGHCVCSGGHEIDPAVAFERSPCCRRRLRRSRCGYRCSGCSAIVTSRFCFDEPVVDARYFREKMRESRRRKRERDRRAKWLLDQNRSDHLQITDLPDMDDLPGLEDELDRLVGGPRESDRPVEERSTIDWGAYREAIFGGLQTGIVDFDRIRRVVEDRQRDRACRFTVLTFLWQDGAVDLRENRGVLEVIRREAHAQG